MTMVRRLLFVPLVVLLAQQSGSQTNPRFNINLQVDYAVAEQLVRLFENQFVHTQSLAELRGSRIAASTTGYIANSSAVTTGFSAFLDSLKNHQIIRNDIYHLEEGRTNVAATKDLLNEIQRRNFSMKVIATVEQIFPSDASINVTLPLYVVAFGHENVDAYVRRIIWHGDIPEFVGEGQGELTIVINLSQAVRYGKDTEERLESLLGVVAHEVFHAAFSAYKDQSATWKRYYRTHQQPIDELLDLTQNEGIAYYLSLDQQGGGHLPRDWNNRVREVFSTFNHNGGELLSSRTSRQRVAELLRTANLSGYWQSYGAMTGMVIAREIDLRLGRAILMKTIESGPNDFFQKYLSLTDQDSDLPRLSPSIIRSFSSN